MLLIFKIQPKIEPHVQNFEISKFELFALKIQKCSILFYWNLGHYLGPKIQQIDHWAQNLCQKPDHHSVCQILQRDFNFDQAVFWRSSHLKIRCFILLSSVDYWRHSPKCWWPPMSWQANFTSWLMGSLHFISTLLEKGFCPAIYFCITVEKIVSVFKLKSPTKEV